MYACTHLDLSWLVAMDLPENLDKLQILTGELTGKRKGDCHGAEYFCYRIGIDWRSKFYPEVQCTQDEKESRKAVYTQLAVAVPMNFVLFALGTLLFLFYVTRADSISPH